MGEFLCLFQVPNIVLHLGHFAFQLVGALHQIVVRGNLFLQLLNPVAGQAAGGDHPQ